MIQRYSRPEMSALWSDEAKFEAMKTVEIAVAIEQAKLKIIPEKASKDISKKAKFEISRILEIEKITKHDVIAFVSNMAENIGENGRYLHFGMTSSDVVDTALCLQIQSSVKVLNKSLDRLLLALKVLAKTHSNTLVSGRTHGMHAEPTSFGLKLLGFYQEWLRNKSRLKSATKGLQIAKLSGAVGTYSTQPFELEQNVAKRLGLIPEPVATQVIPRDRHAELFCVFAMMGGSLERLSTEIRHLQRTEVAEAFEGFSKGQKGSSAMPHKRNPIGSENITGCARLLRGYALSSLENISLWHERDISHSSVERVILPDGFILLDYAIDRMSSIVENLEVRTSKMKDNMDLSQGQLFSSHILLKLVESGLSREEAYSIVQRLSHSLKPSDNLRKALKSDREVSKRISAKEIDNIFEGHTHLKGIQLAFKKGLLEVNND